MVFILDQGRGQNMPVPTKREALRMANNKRNNKHSHDKKQKAKNESKHKTSGSANKKNQYH
ncbi:hypothetical protein [Pontibacillus sp. HMF3514]|nr:hypothetical protein [Pontibacillus sp. HMF3514]